VELPGDLFAVYEATTEGTTSEDVRLLDKTSGGKGAEGMELIWFVLITILSGLVIGALGRLALPGPDPMSIPMTILIGIGGSLIGGLVGRMLFGSDGAGLILSVAGAVLLVWLMRRFRRPRLG
jgi:uncharacterized membrane protein YeaQ/YmgE (transglycosylase-associated protein family)